MDENGKNWREMFERSGRGHDPARGMGGTPPMPRDEPPVEDGLPDLDMAEYKPWVLQRGRSRPALMLHLRRFEPKSGLWMGWQLSYPHLIAVEYVGDKMLSLDFGTRQFMIEGTGLDELARHLQQGTVLVVQEYAERIWKKMNNGTCVIAIQLLNGQSR